MFNTFSTKLKCWFTVHVMSGQYDIFPFKRSFSQLTVKSRMNNYILCSLHCAVCFVNFQNLVSLESAS